MQLCEHTLRTSNVRWRISVSGVIFTCSVISVLCSILDAGVFFSSVWIHRDVPSLPFHFFSWPLSQRSLMCSQQAPDRYSVPVGGRFWFRFVLSLLFLLFHPLNVGFLFSYSTCSFFFLGSDFENVYFFYTAPKNHVYSTRVGQKLKSVWWLCCFCIRWFFLKCRYISRTTILPLPSHSILIMHAKRKY